MRLHDGWRCARAWLALGMLGLGMLGLACGETAAKTSSERMTTIEARRFSRALAGKRERKTR